MKQRVLVLGASGFIGQRVVAALQVSDWAVPVASIHRSPLLIKFVECVKLDIRNKAELSFAIRNVNVVINCISGSASTIVETAHALFSAVSNIEPAPRVVHLSSMAVYGASVGILDESAVINATTSGYASAKITAEYIAASYRNSVILRPGCVYGPESIQWSQRVASWLAWRRAGDLGASGDGICNLAYIDDVVCAILASVYLPGIEGEVFNIGSPDPPTWNEYFVSFSRAIGIVPVSRISRRRLLFESIFLAPVLKAMQIAVRFLRIKRINIPPPIPSSLVKAWEQEIKLDVSKAQRVLNITWTPVDQGLRHTAAGLWAMRDS